MRLLHLALAAVLAFSYGIASAQTGTTTAAGQPTIVTMADTKWMPGTGMMKGLEVAVLSGDPAKSGPYVVRLRIPANTTLPPHYHGEVENVTVISGALWVGLGDKIDQSALKELGPGTFVSLPANVHHYAMTKTETIVQIHGIGPSSMSAVGGM